MGFRAPDPHGFDGNDSDGIGCESRPRMTRRTTALPTDLVAAVVRAGVDPTQPPRALQDALKGAIADRGGYVAWDVDGAGWVVARLRPEREDFRGPTLDEALAWCLMWLMHGELAFGPPT